MTVFVDGTELPVGEGTSLSKEDLPLIMVGELVSIGSHVVLSGKSPKAPKSSGKQLQASSMIRQSIKVFTTTLSPSTSNAQVQTRRHAAGVSTATQAAPTLRSAAVGTPKVRTANTGTDALSVTVVDRGSQCTMKADRLELAACMQQVRELKEQLGASELERALAESGRDAIEADVKQSQAAIIADQPVFLVGSTIWPTAWGTCLI